MIKNEMIKDDRIVNELMTLIDCAEGIIEVYQRDGAIHASYLHEKTSTIEYITRWLKTMCEEE